jgi:DnaK suppressor protein
MGGAASNSRKRRQEAAATGNSKHPAGSTRSARVVTARSPREGVKAAKARKLSSRYLEQIRQLLQDKKKALTDHLQTELSELERPEKRHRSDLEEMASDTHDTDSLCQIMDIEATQITQIDLALRKIDNGTYGVCEDCGDEISLARLEALPFASQCIACKRKSELAAQFSSLSSSG